MAVASPSPGVASFPLRDLRVGSIAQSNTTTPNDDQMPPHDEKEKRCAGQGEIIILRLKYPKKLSLRNLFDEFDDVTNEMLPLSCTYSSFNELRIMPSRKGTS